MKTHSGEKSNKCNQCDFASSRASNLSLQPFEKPNYFLWYLATIYWSHYKKKVLKSSFLVFAFTSLSSCCKTLCSPAAHPRIYQIAQMLPRPRKVGFHVISYGKHRIYIIIYLMIDVFDRISSFVLSEHSTWSMERFWHSLWKSWKIFFNLTNQ